MSCDRDHNMGQIATPYSETYSQGIGKYRFAAYPQNTVRHGEYIRLLTELRALAEQVAKRI